MHALQNYPKQGIDRADIEDTQARQAVRSMLRASKPAVAGLKRIVLRARQNPSTMNKRNFAMAMVALSDCYLRTEKYNGAYEVAQNALGVCPQLSRLQRAEIFRLQANALQANALAAEGGMHQIGDVSTVRNTPEVGALFHNAFLLDPVQYQGQIGKDHDHIGVWNPVVDTEAPLELSASVQDHAKRAGNLRIHCL